MKWGYSGMTKAEIRSAKKNQLYKEQLRDYMEEMEIEEPITFNTPRVAFERKRVRDKCHTP